jgi:GT2 family glycosyltransferase
MRPGLGVVLTTWETWDLAARCVDAVLASGVAGRDVLVVDDASSQPAPDGLARRVRVLRNPENLGLVRSLNLGIRAVDAEVVAVFDSDARPLSGFPEAVLRRFDGDPRLGILGFKTVDSAGRETGSHEPEPGVASLVLGQRLHGLARRFAHFDGRHNASPPCVFSCAMALRKQAFDDLGGFDEQFDWLDLDLDLCMRAHRSAWKVEHAPEIVAFHEGSGAPQATRQRVLRVYQNRWRLLRKFGKVRRPHLVRALVGARLGLELAALQLAGPFLIRDRERLADKLAGRRALLRWWVHEGR